MKFTKEGSQYNKKNLLYRTQKCRHYTINVKAWELPEHPLKTSSVILCLIYLTRTNDVSELTGLIHEYINYYNNERIQLKSGMGPVEYRTNAAYRFFLYVFT